MADKEKMVIQWETVKAEDVVRYFVRGYQDGPPETYDWYYDAQKSVFVLRTFWLRPTTQEGKEK